MQRCQYCSRWFKNYHALKIHQGRCKLKVGVK